MLKRYPVTVFLAMAALAQPLGYAQSDAVQLLIEQGRYWQERGDDPRAIDAWQKLLRVDGNHPEALYGLGLIAAREGNTTQANDYVKRLQALQDSQRATRLEQEILLRSPAAAEQVSRARQAIQEEDVDAALAAYRSALGGREPVGPLALEYYQTLAARESDSEAARAGLERLIAAEPDNSRARLALAEMLTYREPTRRQGIQQLQRLSTDAQVGRLAQESWRTALEWLGTPPARADAALYQAYVNANPDDDEIKALLTAAQRPTAAPGGGGARQAPVPLSPAALAMAQAFRTLEAGRLDEAESQFRGILDKQPNQAEALGGLGLIRLQQQRFPEAATLLQQASQRGSAQRWRGALTAARYWTLFHQAEALSDQGQLNAAADLLAQAVKLDPRELSGQVALATLRARQGQLRQAESDLRALLKRSPRSPEVIQALANVRSLQGAPEDALALMESLSPADQQRFGLTEQLAVARLQSAAKAAADRGNPAAQQQALQEALAIAPQSPWVRLELAQFYLQQGARQEARGLVDGLLISEPGNPDALYASALIAASDNDWAGAMRHLEGIPSEDLTTAMRDLQQEAWLQEQIQRSRQYLAQGQRAHAQAVLRDAEPFAKTPAWRAILAEGYADIGDTGRATELLRAGLGPDARKNPDNLLQYAGLLARGGQDPELVAVLRELQGMDLNPRQRTALEGISLNYTLRQVDLLRQRGDLPGAYDLLAPWLAVRPGDPDLLAALAWLYQDAGDDTQALSYFKPALAQRPDNVGLLLGASNAALRLGDYPYAQSTVEAAMALQPDNADVQSTAALVYRAQGKRSLAIKALETSIALRRRSDGLAQASATAGNPFAALPTAGGAGGTVSSEWASMDPAVLRGMAVVPPEHLAGLTAAEAAALAAGAVPSAPSRPSSRPAPPLVPVVTPMEPLVPMAQSGNPWLGNGRANPTAGPSRQPAAGAQPGWIGYAQPNAAQATRQAGAAPAIVGYGTPASVTAPMAAARRQASVSTGPANPVSALERELQALRAEASPTASGAFLVRGREGEAGMSRYTSVETPLEARLPVGNGRVALRVTPVYIDAGSVGGEYGSSSRFGGGPVAALAQVDGLVGSAGKQDDTGVGIAVAYLGDRVQADIGTTPIGMQQTNVVGGITVGTGGGEGPSASVTASRRAVTDSLLSFAGATDARTGQKWGGVTATGGRIDFGYNSHDWGLYGHGGWYALRGQEVVDNSRLEGSVGVYRHINRSDDHELTVGLNLTGMSYDKNLRHFTYGHGGYFSPQRFLALSVPVGWTQRQGNLRYSVEGSIGVQNFQEDSARYFPGNSQMQLAAQQAAQIAANRQLTGDSSAMYDGQSKTGVGYGVAAAFEYQLAPQWFLGGQLGADNARNYREWRAGLHLRYQLSPSGSQPPLPVVTVKSPY